MARGRKPTKQKLDRFIEVLEQSANVREACRDTGLARRTVYHWRRRDPEFAARMAEAVELGTEALEDEAVRRGMQGVDKPVYQNGKLVGHIREYSDTLLIFMLKARKPNMYRDRQSIEHSGPDGQPLQQPSAITITLVKPE